MCGRWDVGSWDETRRAARLGPPDPLPHGEGACCAEGREGPQAAEGGRNGLSGGWVLAGAVFVMCRGEPSCGEDLVRGANGGRLWQQCQGCRARRSGSLADRDALLPPVRAARHIIAGRGEMPRPGQQHVAPGERGCAAAAAHAGRPPEVTRATTCWRKPSWLRRVAR